jgi:type I restriction enzyme S subunit
MTWASAPLESVKNSGRYSLVGGPFGSELTTRDYVAEGVPVIRGNNLAGQSKFVDDDFVFVSEQKAASLHSNMAYPGDLVFTQRGTLGQVGLIPKDARFSRYVVSQSQMKLTVDEEKAVPLFIYYNFRLPSTIQRILNRVSSSGVPHINLSALKAFEVPLPPPSIQKSIVDIAEKYDALIENNRRRIHLLEDSARLLYREWFVHFRFPGHEHTKVIDGVPERWKRTLFVDIIDINPATSIEKNKVVTHVPMAALSTVGMSVAFELVEKRSKSTTVHFRNGDTLFARITPCLENGKTAYVNFLQEGETACGSTEFIVLRGKRVSSFFVYCLARTDQLRGIAIKSMIGSSGRQRVQESCFTEFIVPMPPRDLLVSFDEFAAPAFRQIQQLTAANDRLYRARDLLLPRLMSGEVEI